MFKRLGHVMLIVALLAATGSHWVVLQSVAWTSMLADNLRTGTLSDAMERTFDGKHPCEMCKHISEAKKSEKKTEFPVTLKKLEYISERIEIVFSAPQDFYTQPAFQFSISGFVHEPAVPPPRTLSS